MQDFCNINLPISQNISIFIGKKRWHVNEVLDFFPWPWDTCLTPRHNSDRRVRAIQKLRCLYWINFKCTFNYQYLVINVIIFLIKVMEKRSWDRVKLWLIIKISWLNLSKELQQNFLHLVECSIANKNHIFSMFLCFKS